jgi:hypothetical protein
MYQSVTLKLVRKHPSGLLLAAQVLTVVLDPLIEQTKAGRAGFVVFGNVVLALALWVVFRSPLLNWIGMVLAVPAMAISLAALVGGYTGILGIGHLLEAAVYFYAAIGLIVYMLSDTDVTMDELLGIGATFTLLAWASPTPTRHVSTLFREVLASARIRWNQGHGSNCFFSALASSPASD